jgi:predicted nucleic acid-binding protein
MILVDTSVFLDVVRDDQEWASWSNAALETAAAQDTLAINPIVYAEMSTQFEEIERLDLAVATLKLTMREVPREGLFLAGKIFKRYRAAGGTKSSVLPDFFIGAHAAVEGATLLTRDPKRVRTYFRKVRLIAP